MKKFFALFLAVLVGFSFGSIRSAGDATAVTLGTPNYGTHDTVVTSEASAPVKEEVRFILDKSGKAVGVLTEHEATYRKNIGIVAYNGRTVKSAMANGKIVRSKNVATVTLDADNKLLQGSSIVEGTIEYLDASTAEFSAAELIDMTVVAHENADGTYTAYHRFIQSDRAGEKVAILHLSSGNCVSIWLTDWNEDGLVSEYALRAGTAPNSSGSSSSSSSGGNPGGGNPGGGNNGGETPRPPVQGSQNSYNDAPRDPVEGSSNSFSDAPSGW